jgi:hypothetical protein
MKIAVIFFKLTRYFWCSIKEMIKEFCHLMFSSKKISSTIEDSLQDKRFIEINSHYWQERQPLNSEGIILVEGFF